MTLFNLDSEVRKVSSITPRMATRWRSANFLDSEVRKVSSITRPDTLLANRVGSKPNGQQRGENM